MSETTNIVISDGTSDLTFNPIRRLQGGLVSFLNKVGTIVASFPGLYLKHDYWSGRRSTIKIDAGLDFPLERTDAVTGVVSATDVARVRVTYTLPKTITSGERTKVFNLVKNLTGSTVMQAYVVNDDPMM